MASLFGMGLAAGLAKSVDTQLQEGQARAQELADKIRDYHLSRAETTRQEREKRMSSARETVRTLNSLTGDPNRSALLIQKYRSPELALQKAQEIDAYTSGEYGISKEDYYNIDASNDFTYTENDLAYSLANMDLLPSYEFGTTGIVGEGRKDLGIFGTITGFDPEAEGAKSAQRIMGTQEQMREAFRPVEEIKGTLRTDLLPTGKSHKDLIQEYEQLALKFANDNPEKSKEFRDKALRLRKLVALDEEFKKSDTKPLSPSAVKVGTNYIATELGLQLNLTIPLDKDGNIILNDQTSPELARMSNLAANIFRATNVARTSRNVSYADVLSYVSDLVSNDQAFEPKSNDAIIMSMQDGPITVEDLFIINPDTSFREQYGIKKRIKGSGDTGPPDIPTGLGNSGSETATPSSSTGNMFPTEQLNKAKNASGKTKEAMVRTLYKEAVSSGADSTFVKETLKSQLGLSDEELNSMLLRK